jgi:hypothetical protein
VSGPRIALLGFSIACDRFASVSTEVDAPGLTSPILSRFPWKHKPRPVLPIGDYAE